jgi:hypothetical protein
MVSCEGSAAAPLALPTRHQGLDKNAGEIDGAARSEG